MKRVLAILLASMGTSAVSAGDWTPPLTLSYAFTEATTDLIVFTTTDGSSFTPGCQVNAWMFNADTVDRRSRGYATLMTALTAGKKVRLWFGNSCTTWGYHSATSIMIVG